MNASHLENSTPGSQRRRSSRFHERVGSADQRRGGGSGRRLCGHGCSGAAGALACAAHRAWQVTKVAARIAWGETWGWLGSCVLQRQVGLPDVGASLLPQPPAGSCPTAARHLRGTVRHQSAGAEPRSCEPAATTTRSVPSSASWAHRAIRRASEEAAAMASRCRAVSEGLESRRRRTGPLGGQRG